MTTIEETGREEIRRLQHGVAFAGHERIAEGDLAALAKGAKAALAAGETRPILIFDAQTSEPIEIDLRPSNETATRRREAEAAAAEPRGPGRPRLGVIAREVTLLPRHWDWLSAQPGGASVALRKLVENARRAPDPVAMRRQALESAYRFMSAMAGNEKGFEEATRALFRGERDRFRAETTSWPADVRAHARHLTRHAWVIESRPATAKFASASHRRKPKDTRGG